MTVFAVVNVWQTFAARVPSSISYMNRLYRVFGMTPFMVWYGTSARAASAAGRRSNTLPKTATTVSRVDSVSSRQSCSAT